MDACDAVAKDAVNKHGEHSTRGMRLHSYPVSSEQRESGAISDEHKKNDTDDY